MLSDFEKIFASTMLHQIANKPQNFSKICLQLQQF